MPGSSVALKIGQRVRIGVTIPPQPGGANPWLFEGEIGSSDFLAVKDGGIHIRASHFGGPPFWQSSVPVTAGAANPRMAEGPDGRLWLTFEKDGNSWSAWSSDGANTFTEPAVVITGGSKPTVASGEDGTLIFAAIVGGVLTARVWQAGRQVPGAPFAVQKFDAGITSAFAVEDDTFHLAHERQPHGRFWLHALAAGETDTSAWWSGDWWRHDGPITFTRGPA